ncbi:MAG TPA: hypothetical protein VFB34_12070, partial [Chloroflexota bacterium]|nr:hypothetical protein [Chloroflexota bacterium]
TATLMSRYGMPQIRDMAAKSSQPRRFMLLPLPVGYRGSSASLRCSPAHSQTWLANSIYGSS